MKTCLKNLGSLLVVMSLLIGVGTEVKAQANLIHLQSNNNDGWAIQARDNGTLDITGTNSNESRTQQFVLSYDGHLSIKRRAGATQSFTGGLNIGGARNANNNTFAKIDFYNYDSNGSSTDFVGASIKAYQYGPDAAGLKFDVAQNAGGTTTALFIDASTNVSMTNNLAVSGTITANQFIGDGSALTGVNADITGGDHVLSENLSINVDQGRFTLVDNLNTHLYLNNGGEAASLVLSRDENDDIENWIGLKQNDSFTHGERWLFRTRVHDATTILAEQKGNVGIGMTNPQHKLDVSGTVRADGFTARGDGHVEMALVNDSGGRLDLTYDIDEKTNEHWIGFTDGGAPGNWLFRTKYGSSRTIGSTIMAEGEEAYVGVGELNPVEKLDVAGNVKANAFIGDGSQLTGIIADNLNINEHLDGNLYADILIGPEAGKSLISDGVEITEYGNNLIGYQAGARLGYEYVEVGSIHNENDYATNILNTIIGNRAGSNMSAGSRNIILGADAGSNMASGSNNIVIGAVGETEMYNKLRIGDTMSGGSLLEGDLGTNPSLLVNGTFAVEHDAQFQENLVVDGTISGDGSGLTNVPLSSIQFDGYLPGMGFQDEHKDGTKSWRWHLGSQALGYGNGNFQIYSEYNLTKIDRMTFQQNGPTIIHGDLELTGSLVSDFQVENDNGTLFKIVNIADSPEGSYAGINIKNEQNHLESSHDWLLGLMYDDFYISEWANLISDGGESAPFRIDGESGDVNMRYNVDIAGGLNVDGLLTGTGLYLADDDGIVDPKLQNLMNHNFHLAVDGKAIAEEMIVLNSENWPWPDYVFEEEYELSSLEEVESFIDANGHLEDVPSATQVDEKGVNLGEMDAVLLRKIEELTLHMIEINKQIKVLTNENAELKAALNNPK